MSTDNAGEGQCNCAHLFNEAFGVIESTAQPAHGPLMFIAGWFAHARNPERLVVEDAYRAYRIGDLCPGCLHKPCECPVDETAARAMFDRLAEHPATPAEGGHDGLTDDEYGGLPWDKREPTMRAALNALIAAREREAERRGAEKALREAADDWAGGEWRGVNFNREGRDEHPGMRQARWLRARADATRSR